VIDGYLATEAEYLQLGVAASIHRVVRSADCRHRRCRDVVCDRRLSKCRSGNRCVIGAAFLLAAHVTFEVVLLTWFALTPLASFYLRYPIDRSIITYSRVVFGLLVVMLLLESHRKLNRTGALLDTSASTGTFSLSKFEIAWALLSLLALASAVARSNNVAYATRIAIDTFLAPAPSLLLCAEAL